MTITGSTTRTLALVTLLVSACGGGGDAVESYEPTTARASAGGEAPSGGAIARGSSRTLAGELRDGDARDSEREAFYDRYTVTAAAGDRLRVIMWSLDFDTYLIVRGPNGEEIATDDDGSGTLDAFLEIPIEVAGAHTIVATSYSGDARGSYALHVHAAAELPEPLNVEVSHEGEGEGEYPGEEPSDPPVVDQRLNGTIVQGGPLTSRGAAFHGYPIFAQAGDTLYAMMRAEAFDTYLHLIDPTGQEVDASDDNPTAGGLNSYIVHVAQMSGQYTVQASTYSMDGTGSYELLLGRQAGSGAP